MPQPASLTLLIKEIVVPVIAVTPKPNAATPTVKLSSLSGEPDDAVSASIMSMPFQPS